MYQDGGASSWRFAGGGMMTDIEKARTGKCTICGKPTELACSDCQIDLRTTVYVCSTYECRKEHEQKCSHELLARKADNSRVALEICLEQQKRADDAERELKALDAVLDEEGCARSSINPKEDLRLALRGLKADVTRLDNVNTALVAQIAKLNQELLCRSEVPAHNPATSGPTLSHVTPNGDVLHIDTMSKVTKENR